MIIEKNKPLSSLTSWKIGGPAKTLFVPESKEELIQAIKSAKDSGIFFIIGNGTNILAKDEGFAGSLIKLGKNFAQINFEKDSIVRAGASAPLVSLAVKTAQQGLAGLEFASGIPGTLGGAIVMNAGAHGSDMKNIIIEVSVYDMEKEKMLILKNEEMDFSYRKSILKNNSRYIVIEALLQLKQGSKSDLLDVIKKNKEERWARQPYDFPNGGSVFKNPPGESAGKLIEEAGLKGYRINDAQISEKHGNFIINKGQASAQDVFNIINHVEKIIKEKYNINLEREIIILG